MSSQTYPKTETLSRHEKMKCTRKQTVPTLSNIKLKMTSRSHCNIGENKTFIGGI